MDVGTQEIWLSVKDFVEKFLLILDLRDFLFDDDKAVEYNY